MHLSKAYDCMYVELVCKTLIHDCPEWAEDYGKMEKRHRVSVAGYKVSLESDANVLKWIATLA